MIEYKMKACWPISYLRLSFYHERDWPPCKVVFRVGNQNAECEKQQQKQNLEKSPRSCYLYIICCTWQIHRAIVHTPFTTYVLLVVCRSLERGRRRHKTQTHAMKHIKRLGMQIRHVRFVLFSPNEQRRGMGGGVRCQTMTFSFVLFSLFSRPRAGLADV